MKQAKALALVVAAMPSSWARRRRSWSPMYCSLKSRHSRQLAVGIYTAETFLIQDGRVIAGTARDIEIEKLGFERFVATAAQRWPMLYGLASVTIYLLLK